LTKLTLAIFCMITAGFLALPVFVAQGGVVSTDFPDKLSESQAGEESYSRALRLLEQGHVAQALAGLNSAIAHNPSDSHLYNLRGLAYISLGEPAQAEADFRKVIQLAPKSTAGYNNLASLLDRSGKRTKAVPLFETALKISPTDFTALVGLGTVLLNEGKLEKARPLLQRAWAERRGDFQTGYELALALHELNRPEAAQQIIGQIPKPKAWRRAAKYHALRAAIASDLRNFSAALQQYRAAYECSPRGFGIYLALVQTCLKIAGCDPGPTLATAPAPLSAEEHFALGLLFASRRRYALAIPHFEETLRQAPGSYSAAYDLAIVQEKSGNIDAAMQALKALIQHRPEAELYNLLASVQEKKGLYVAAAHDFQRAVDMNPAREEYFFDLGSDYLAHFTFGPALQVFKEGTQRFPSIAREFTGLGFALYAQQNYLSAAQAFLKALQIDPQSRPALHAYSSLIELVVPAGWKTIVPQLKHLAGTYPERPAAVYCYGASLFQHALPSGNQTELNRAQSLLEEAIRLQAEFPEAHLELGNLLAAEKNYRSALREFREAVRQDPRSSTGYYRLAETYRNLDQIDLAERELNVYRQLTQAKDERMARTRAAIQQFIMAEGSPPRVSWKDRAAHDTASQ
jgi:tetratricopeptide (TPR) repeat protein